MYYPQVDPKINGVCKALEIFDENDQQELLSSLPGMTKDELIEYTAYMLALNKSTDACHNSIKRYIGEDSSSWTYPWYRALSGCNILAGELNVEHEEAGYYIWYVIEKKFSCSAIEHNALKEACSAVGAGSPVLFYAK